MMKKIVLFTGILLLTCNIGLFAQGNQIDAYTLSATEVNGTARSMAMGGAFGALGGDISVISSNPAGLGIYRSSEISGSLDLSMGKTSAVWSGVTSDQKKTHFSPNNFGFELYFPTGTESVRNWNLGFSYNRLKNFNRRYRMSSNGQSHSLADYEAWRASNAFGAGNGITESEFVNAPYDNPDLSGNWLAVLGYDNLFYHYAGNPNEYQSAFGYWNDDKTVWNIMSPYKNYLSVNESGHMDEYNIGFGMNVSNFLFLGASLSVTDINYKYSSFYEELFAYDEKNNDELYLENWLNTEGSAVSLNVGVITNLQALRLGVAYNSPRRYNMTDYYDARSGSYINNSGSNPNIDAWIPEKSYSKYRFRSPGKWIFSGAVILGQFALISADYELVDYRKMQYSSADDYTRIEYAANRFIKDDFSWAHTLKLGAEAKITPQFAVRAGYVVQTSPMRETLVKNEVEVLPSGTIPHFAVTSKPTTYYTAGLGYRFTSNFYMDLACVYRHNRSDVYAFSRTYGGVDEVPSTPASLTSETTRLALTLGYKF
jgi:hypothetical protein